MRISICIFLLLTVCFGKINGDPYFIWPQHMLPSSGETFSFTTASTLNGISSTTSELFIQPVVTQNSKTVIGYRPYGLTDLGNGGIVEFVSVSYTNGSIFSRQFHRQSGECYKFPGDMVFNCKSWSRIDMLTYEHRCHIIEFNEDHQRHWDVGEQVLTLHIKITDLTRPVFISHNTTSPGGPNAGLPLVSVINYLKKNGHAIFPYIKCEF